MQQVLRSLDRVRRAENKDLRAEGDDTLVRTKYLWFCSQENVPAAGTDHFSALKFLALTNARAWALKESLRTLWDCNMRGWAIRFWKRWSFRATHSKLAPMIEAARAIQRHLHNVLTFFDHRITNAVAESLNSKISTIQKRSCGLRNCDHIKITVCFHCDGLNLCPPALTPRNV